MKWMTFLITLFLVAPLAYAQDSLYVAVAKADSSVVSILSAEDHHAAGCERETPGAIRFAPAAESRLSQRL